MGFHHGGGWGSPVGFYHGGGGTPVGFHHTNTVMTTVFDISGLRVLVSLLSSSST